MVVTTDDSRSGGAKPEPGLETLEVQPERSTSIPDPAASASDGDLDSSVDQPREKQPWEQPGAWGTTRRYLRNIRGFIWDDPDKPKEEKRFLFKLDLFMLTATGLGYFTKGLDSQNLNNAYISGMREALQLEGSELTYAGNLFTTGYVLGAIPAVILTTRLRPSILIPTLELFWTVLTFCTMAVQNKSQLYAIRFLIGLAESAYFPVVMYVLGSWYTKSERGKRLTIFYCITALSVMFSGYLQAGAYNGLSGRLGHAGWQWLYIVCGVISLPVALIGYWFIPDFPETTRAFYITPKEAQWARERLIKEGLSPLGASQWDRKKIFRIMAQWQFWVLPIGYFLIQGAMPVQQPVFALWLKASGHSVYEANVYPTGQPAVGVVVQLLAAQITDSRLLKGRRWQAILFLQAGTLFSDIVLAVWDVSDALKYAAFYMSWFAFGIPALYFAWFSELIPHDHEMRGFVIAWTNTFSFVMSIWYAAVVWKTVDAPRYRAGFIFASTLAGAVILIIFTILFLERRDIKKRAREQQGLTDIETPVVPGSDSEKDAVSSGSARDETPAVEKGDGQ